MSDADGFLSRWSKKKMAREAPAEPADAAAPAAPTLPSATAPVAAGASTAAPNPELARPAATALQPEAPALPNLDDVAKLTRESDYAPYMNRQLDPQVRNAAMKKLFSDPHFNVMDGLDTYIDDYGKPDPLPLSMLRQMTSARALGLFADEEAAEAKALAAAKPSADAGDARDPANPNPDAEPPLALAASEADAIKASRQSGEPQTQADAAAAKVDAGGGVADPG